MAPGRGEGDEAAEALVGLGVVGVTGLADLGARLSGRVFGSSAVHRDNEEAACGRSGDGGGAVMGRQDYGVGVGPSVFAAASNNSLRQRASHVMY
jgi:hypothetical protein